MAPSSEERAEADQLVKSGYAVTSRKYGGVARIDRPDWVRVVRRHIRCSGDDDLRAADWYRRVLSRDKRTVTPRVRALMPNSGDAQFAYREIS